MGRYSVSKIRPKEAFDCVFSIYGLSSMGHNLMALRVGKHSHVSLIYVALTFMKFISN